LLQKACLLQQGKWRIEKEINDVKQAISERINSLKNFHKKEAIESLEIRIQELEELCKQVYFFICYL